MNALDRQRLLRDHRHLDEKISQMLGQGFADPIELKRLKKRKLAIKDRLHMIAPQDVPSAPVEVRAANAA